MQQIIRHTFYVVLTIFSLSALLCFAGLGYTWFYLSAPAIEKPSEPPKAAGEKKPENDKVDATKARELPFLGLFVTSIIIEAAGVVFLFLKTGLKYLPQVTINKSESETFDFMCNLLTLGTTVTIVTNRASLLTRSEKFRNAVTKSAESGIRLEFITPTAIADEVRLPLEQAGVSFLVTGELNPPEARFTLINADRAGGETLAIARGTHPAHEITVFDASSGPQMIAMAKDIVRKSKALAHAA